MDRNEKVHLSLSLTTAHVFRQGVFLRLYEASLCWFVHNVRPLKIMQEKTKEGKILLYGGLPKDSFAAVKDTLPDLKETDYGFTWNCTGNTVEPLYSQWRDEQFTILPALDNKSVKSADKEVLERVRNFELARATPLDAMNAIAAWQKELHELRKEGA